LSLLIVGDSVVLDEAEVVGVVVGGGSLDDVAVVSLENEPVGELIGPSPDALPDRGPKVVVVPSAGAASCAAAPEMPKTKRPKNIAAMTASSVGRTIPMRLGASRPEPTVRPSPERASLSARTRYAAALRIAPRASAISMPAQRRRDGIPSDPSLLDPESWRRLRM